MVKKYNVLVYAMHILTGNFMKQWMRTCNILIYMCYTAQVCIAYRLIIQHLSLLHSSHRSEGGGKGDVLQ
jgi:hypothetical protein